MTTPMKRSPTKRWQLPSVSAARPVDYDQQIAYDGAITRTGETDADQTCAYCAIHLPV